ncbi:hypothetical protein PIB30_056440 [Stylosanthes scabra]|uniref:Uncharacterized protein n=1 Tax=Stylosanthes scabra TaxID=79078 RepID=A0ABU6VHY0_9FABA|nr:hypothetical protein [Stylosanthes scabra]
MCLSLVLWLTWAFKVRNLLGAIGKIGGTLSKNVLIDVFLRFSLELNIQERQFYTYKILDLIIVHCFYWQIEILHRNLSVAFGFKKDGVTVRRSLMLLKMLGRFGFEGEVGTRKE